MAIIGGLLSASILQKIDTEAFELEDCVLESGSHMKTKSSVWELNNKVANRGSQKNHTTIIAENTNENVELILEAEQCVKEVSNKNRGDQQSHAIESLPLLKPTQQVWCRYLSQW